MKHAALIVAAGLAAAWLGAPAAAQDNTPPAAATPDAPSMNVVPPAPSSPPPAANASPPAILPPGVSPPLTAEAAEDSRFTFHRVQDSFVRLDGRTGQVSVCGREVSGWACRAVPDERAALEEAIVRLQQQSAALKKELLNRGLPLPAGVKADQPEPKVSEKPADKAEPKLPTDAELDRVVGFIEKVWRRLVEIMVDFQRDMQRKS